jgi:hypothetical protein
MTKPIDPLARRDIADLKKHSEEGIRALTSILARDFAGARPRDILEDVLDRLERVAKDYRNIAHELAPEDSFPERGHRWPGLFDQSPPRRRKSRAKG